MTISIYDKYAKVDSSTGAVSAPTTDGAHGLSGTQIDQMHARMEKYSGVLTGSGQQQSRILSEFDTLLPKGANWDPRRTAQSLTSQNSGARTLVTQQIPYQPEFASPDRQSYPVHRILANRYWRLFFKLDPVIGNCIELYSELPWSNFELTGDGVEGEIKQAYERMCRDTQVLAMLPYFVREYMVLGEAAIHTFFDDSRGIFSHIAMHNPDQLEVIDAPFIKMDPIIQFRPDDRLKAVMASDEPQIAEIRQHMPPELLSKLNSNQNITLSPLNCTFIPRRLHPYDTRGTSIISRLWRVLMLEDAITSASLQIARRHASPLKVAKLGNAATGFIPPPEQEKKLAELLAMAEQDPNAWLIYHYGIQFETVGTTDRAMNINREWDALERMKLVGLGVNKSFLVGETTYAAASTGLQVFLQRLKALRLMFESKWLYPKFFKPVAEINGWIKPRPNEVAHRYRIKRSSKELEQEHAYILPKIVWDKSLDPQMNTDLINAMVALEGIGVKFSKTSKMAAVGYSFEDEAKKSHREQDFEKQFMPAIPSKGGAPGGGGGSIGGGAPPPPPGAPEDEGGAPPGEVPPPGPEAPHAPSGETPMPGASPEGASKQSAEGDKDKKPKIQKDELKPTKSKFDNLKSEIWVDNNYGNWRADEVSDLVTLLKEGETEDPFWAQLGMSKLFKKSVEAEDAVLLWDVLDDYLSEHDYPDSDIAELKFILETEGVLKKRPEMTKELVNFESLIDDRMSDAEFMKAVDGIAQNIKKDGPPKDDDKFLSGI